MKIYWMKILDEGYNFDINFGPDDEEMNEFFSSLGHKHFNGVYPKKLKLRCIKKKGYTDFQDVFMTHHIVREKALNIMSQFYKKECEPLPFEFKKETFYLINIPIIEDLLIQKKSYHITKQKTDTESGYDYYFYWFVFDMEKLKGHNIFQAGGLTCVTEEFKQMFDENGLQGAFFKEIWDSDEGEEPDLERMANYFNLIHNRTLPSPDISKGNSCLETKKLSDEKLVEKIVAISSRKILELLEDFKHTEEACLLQMMWFFDGQLAELACYIESAESASELILTNDSAINEYVEKYLELLQENYESSEDDEFIDLFNSKLKSVCVKIGEEIKSQSNSKIRISEPSEYD